MRTRIAYAVIVFGLAAARPAPAQEFNAVWAAGPGDVWAASRTTLYHGGSGSWIQIVPATGDIHDHRAIGGSGPRDVWIVGDHGQILHWNGTALQGMRAPVRGDIVGVAACAPNDAWAVVQSDNEDQPPVLLRWNGSAWTPQRLPFAFRVAGLAGTCPDLAIAGTAHFDPRPDQRRDAGVVMRLQGDAWVSSGWDGHRVADPDIGGQAWASISANNGCVLLRGGPGNSALLLGCRGGVWTRLTPTGEYETAVLLGNGTPVLVRKGGFSTWTGGTWHHVGQTELAQMDTHASQLSSQMMAPTGAVDTAKVRVLTQRMDSLQRSLHGHDPTGPQMQQMMLLSQQLMQANGMAGTMANMARNPEQMKQRAAAQEAQTQQNQQVMAQAQRNNRFAFGERPAVFAPAGAGGFYVGARSGIMHVTGDESRIVFSPVCAAGAAAASLPDCAPEPGTPRAAPLAAVSYPALPPEPAEAEDQPAQRQPARPTIGIPRPRIRLPGRP